MAFSFLEQRKHLFKMSEVLLPAFFSCQCLVVNLHWFAPGFISLQPRNAFLYIAEPPRCG